MSRKNRNNAPPSYAAFFVVLKFVNHNKEQYVRPDHLTGCPDIHVNGLENFWRNFKSSVPGTHIHISRNHAQKYVDEFVFRANHRQMGNAMFDALIAAV